MRSYESLNGILGGGGGRAPSTYDHAHGYYLIFVLCLKLSGKTLSIEDPYATGAQNVEEGANNL